MGINQKSIRAIIDFCNCSYPRRGAGKVIVFRKAKAAIQHYCRKHSRKAILIPINLTDAQLLRAFKAFLHSRFDGKSVESVFESTENNCERLFVKFLECLKHHPEKCGLDYQKEYADWID